MRRIRYVPIGLLDRTLPWGLGTASAWTLIYACRIAYYVGDSPTQHFGTIPTGVPYWRGLTSHHLFRNGTRRTAAGFEADHGPDSRARKWSHQAGQGQTGRSLNQRHAHVVAGPPGEKRRLPAASRRGPSVMPAECRGAIGCEESHNKPGMAAEE